MKEENSKHNICTSTENVLDLHMVDCTHVCRYHKFPSRTSYNCHLLAPKGMCIDLFHSAYPYCFSLLYGGKHEEKVTVDCPNPDSNVSIKIKRNPKLDKFLRKFIVWMLSVFGYDIEFPSDDIIMEIQHDVNDVCLHKYKKGQRFKFNIWQGREVCPATFDALYPHVHNLMRGGNTPWSDENDVGDKVVCPDPKSNITMSIKKNFSKKNE